MTKRPCRSNQLLTTVQPPYGSAVKGFMTRDFNKQQRDDSRPSFRDKPSYNNGEERPPRPGRPRLNRETVDRAWQSGAQRTHADYRTRSTNGQPPRNNWRNPQPSENSSSQNNRDGNRPYNTNRPENYRDNPRRFDRTSNDSYGQRGPGARSFNTGNPDNTSRPPYNNSRPGERRTYPEQANGTGPRPDYRRDNGRPGNRDDQFRGQDRDNRRHNVDRNSPPPGRQGPGGYRDRDASPDTRNPRGQNNRTWTPRENTPYGRQGPPARGPRSEQYQGDYERFDGRDDRPAGRHDNPRQGNYPNNRAPRGGPNRDYKAPAPERQLEQHVTRLPDGRVLKGPRPVQRQEAKFWTEVANDTEGLIEQVHIAPSDVEELPQVEGGEEAPNDSTEDSKAARKSRARSASATVRGRKGTGKERGIVAKPSQRGFKWPSE